ncbi:MAG: nucleotide pyrophosphohydrolase [Patescibacteria group bacterium]
MQKRILKFAKDRDWLQFHTPRNLAESIIIEASELLELFQFDRKPKKQDIKEEVADVLIYCYQICSLHGWNVDEVIEEKLKINAEKYPISKFKGSNKKYNE